LIPFKRFAAFLDSVPREEHDADLMRFVEHGPIPVDQRRLVVHRDAAQEPWFVADGYHRGILMMKAGMTETDVFAGVRDRESI
jgi:hypothetical protein